jgi:hypothetical protein
METIEITGIQDINALHDYLIGKMDSFRRVRVDAEGRSHALDDCGSVLHDPLTGITRVIFSPSIQSGDVAGAIESFKLKIK